MQVKLRITKWKIERDEESKTQKICGNYEIASGATVIAKQNFNDGYNDVKIPFSTKLMVELEGIEKKIEAEIQEHIT